MIAQCLDHTYIEAVFFLCSLNHYTEDIIKHIRKRSCLRHGSCRDMIVFGQSPKERCNTFKSERHCLLPAPLTITYQATTELEKAANSSRHYQISNSRHILLYHPFHLHSKLLRRREESLDLFYCKQNKLIQCYLITSIPSPLPLPLLL